MLKRSTDRKVANAVTKSGKPQIANSFGLPAGRKFSCPGATSVCGSICYADRLQKAYTNVQRVVMDNYEALVRATYDEMIVMLDAMMAEFSEECERKSASRLFRIHWDGDFFSQDYADAWSEVITRHPTVRFWCYTRNADAAITLHKAGHDNLSLYFSADSDNSDTALLLRKGHGIRLAWLGRTFAEAQEQMKAATGRPGGKCPEQLGRIPLISTEGSACVRCGLCVYGKGDIVFSITKK